MRARILVHAGIGLAVSLLIGLVLASGASIGEPFRDVPELIAEWLMLTLVVAGLAALVCVPLALVGGLAFPLVGKRQGGTRGILRPTSAGVLLGLVMSLPFAAVWSLAMLCISFRNPGTEILAGNPVWFEWFALEVGATAALLGCIGAWVSGLVMLEDVWPGWRCTRCGYDLRGTPERCPECGLRAEVRVDSGHGEENESREEVGVQEDREEGARAQGRQGGAEARHEGGGQGCLEEEEEEEDR